MRGMAQDHKNGQRPRSRSSTDIPAAAVQAQLQKILASEACNHAERLRQFLRFVVERTRQGEGDQLKEYRLGVEVFGQGEAFDPKTDTIVKLTQSSPKLRCRCRKQTARVYGS